MDNDDIKFQEYRPIPRENEQIYGMKSGFGDKLADSIVRYSGGLIKNKNQANMVILIIAGIIFTISMIIFFN